MVIFTVNVRMGMVDGRRFRVDVFITPHIHHVNVRHFQFFGHVHQFWSYSFGHLDSVKWITLAQSSNLFVLHSSILYVWLIYFFWIDKQKFKEKLDCGCILRFLIDAFLSALKNFYFKSKQSKCFLWSNNWLNYWYWLN